MIAMATDEVTTSFQHCSVQLVFSVTITNHLIVRFSDSSSIFSKYFLYNYSSGSEISTSLAVDNNDDAVVADSEIKINGCFKKGSKPIVRQSIL